jgi:hypothetical protein
MREGCSFPLRHFSCCEILIAMYGADGLMRVLQATISLASKFLGRRFVIHEGDATDNAGIL